jgi:hypothetical protein
MTEAHPAHLTGGASWLARGLVDHRRCAVAGATNIVRHVR